MVERIFLTMSKNVVTNANWWHKAVYKQSLKPEIGNIFQFFHLQANSQFKSAPWMPFFKNINDLMIAGDSIDFNKSLQ